MASFLVWVLLLLEILPHAVLGVPDIGDLDTLRQINTDPPYWIARHPRQPTGHKYVLTDRPLPNNEKERICVVTIKRYRHNSGELVFRREAMALDTQRGRLELHQILTRVWLSTAAVARSQADLGSLKSLFEQVDARSTEPSPAEEAIRIVRLIAGVRGTKLTFAVTPEEYPEQWHLIQETRWYRDILDVAGQRTIAEIKVYSREKWGEPLLDTIKVTYGPPRYQIMLPAAPPKFMDRSSRPGPSGRPFGLSIDRRPGPY